MILDAVTTIIGAVIDVIAAVPGYLAAGQPFFGLSALAALLAGAVVLTSKDPTTTPEDAERDRSGVDHP